mgnify:CR=1 FL=1
MTEYLKNLQLEQLFTKLGVANPETFAKTVEHFTAKEAKKRDKIVIDYFGESGVNQIVNTITEFLVPLPKLSTNATLLDIGAGSGFFTVKVAKKMQTESTKVSFYAIDLTPAMLISLAKKKTNVIPFIGIAENIPGSIKEARRFIKVPYRFDGVFSTLMLHHSNQPEKVFRNLKMILKKKGKAIVIDLCKHSFKEFRTEMGDVHLGFKPENIYKMAKKYFPIVEVDKLPGICCKSSGRSAEIFVATMKNY